MSGGNEVERFLSQLASSPDIYVHKLDMLRDTALLVAVNEQTYREASFLDNRVLHPTMPGGWVPIPRLVVAARSLSGGVPLHFIFHSGHVGSTLVSRLLDEAGGVLSLREPLPLRGLAELHDRLPAADSLISAENFGALSEIFLRLWARGYADTRAVILKATSSSARLAPRLLSQRTAARALYLNLKAEPYLATFLAGSSTGADLRGHGPERIRRLQAYGFAFDSAYHALSPGELTAMSWLAEAWSQYRAIAAGHRRVLAVDFDAFLGSLEEHLEQILAHFGLPTDTQTVSRIAASPALTKYSKAQQHDYSPELRAQILAQSRVAHADEIARGLAWLDKAARVNAQAAAIVGASATAST